MPNKRWHITLAPLALYLLLVPTSTRAQSPTVRASTPEQIKEEFVKVPCDNEARLAAVRALFDRAAALPSEITTDKYPEVENLLVMKKGESSEKIVIGAHYDKVIGGCGALDNWTGIVALVHLYRTLKDIPLRKSSSSR